MISNFQFLEINPDVSKLSRDLKEILKKQDEILVTLKELQMKIQNLEQTLSYSKGGRLPISFGTEPLLHQKGKTKMVQKPLTDE